MGKYGYYDIEYETELHECDFCSETKKCVYWFDPEDIINHMCEDCALKIINIINKNNIPKTLAFESKNEKQLRPLEHEFLAIRDLLLGCQKSCDNLRKTAKNITFIHANNEEYDRLLFIHDSLGYGEDDTEIKIYNNEIVPYIIWKDNLYLSFKDQDCYSVEQLDFVINTVVNFVKGKTNKIFIHCLLGMSRTPFIACGYLLKTNQVKTVEEFRNAIKFTYLEYNDWKPIKNWESYLKTLEKEN